MTTIPSGSVTPVLTHAEAPPEVEQRRSVRGHILFTIMVLLALATAWRLHTVLGIVYVSALFAVVLTPVVRRIERLRVGRYQPSRAVAILGLMLSIMVLLFLLFFFGLPPVVSDLERFTADLPQRAPEMVARAKQVPFLNKIGLDNLAQQGEAFVTGFASFVVAEAPRWLGHIFDLLTALILCVYFMLEGESAYFYFLAMVPQQRRNRLAKALSISEVRMSKWLLGQGSLMLILGLSSTIVFGFLRVRYFFLLGTMMGLLNIIPVLGGVVTILLAAGAAALDSWSRAAGVLIFYAIYTQVENGFLIPRIMKTSVNLMGLTVLIALLVGTALGGIVGALVSVPTAALVAVFVHEYLVQDDAEARNLLLKSEQAAE